MENCQKVDFALHLKVAIDTRDASVIVVRGICISTLWSFQNQCYVNSHVRSNLGLIGFEYFLGKNSSY